MAPGGSLLLGGTVAVPAVVGAAGPGGRPAGRAPPRPDFRVAGLGVAAAARHDGEQSGEAGARLQAPGAASAGAQRAAGAGVPGGRVVERGSGQLPQRAALRQEAALRFPRGARGHPRRHRHLLLAQQRGAPRGLHLAAAAAAAQVRPAGAGDPRHRLPRRRHLHQGRLPAGGGETGRRAGAAWAAGDARSGPRRDERAVRGSPGAQRGEVSASRGGRRGDASGRGACGVMARCALCCAGQRAALRAVRGCSVERGVGLYGGVWNGVVWDAG